MINKYIKKRPEVRKIQDYIAMQEDKENKTWEEEMDRSWEVEKLKGSDKIKG